MKRLLESIPIDRDAEERSWQVVRAAHAERTPVRRRVRPRLALVLAALVAAAAAAVLSPAGRAVVDAVRRTIAVEHASPVLFRLPSPGRLLVSGAGGAWIVHADGSRRRVGAYPAAAWSPHALFVAGASANRLAAVNPQGTVHWTLERPGIRSPAWGGSRLDTRIAYFSNGKLRLVGGDGRGDRAAPGPRATMLVQPAWRPGDRRLLAYVTLGGRVAVLDADRGRVAWIARNRSQPRALAWSRDGKTLAVATRSALVLLDGDTGRARVVRVDGIRALAWSPDGRLAVVRGRSVLELMAYRLAVRFAAPAPPVGLAWSPNGRWLVTALPAADQWIFVSGRRVLAFSNIRSQFGAVASLDGWVAGS